MTFKDGQGQGLGGGYFRRARAVTAMERCFNRLMTHAAEVSMKCVTAYLAANVRPSLALLSHHALPGHGVALS